VNKQITRKTNTNNETKMNTKLNTYNTRASGMSRTAALLWVGALVVACVTGLLGLRLRATNPQVDQPVQLGAEGECRTHEDTNHNLKLAVPADWTIEAGEPNGPAAMTFIGFRPPDDMGMNTLAVWKHPPSHGLSARAWAEKEVAQGARMGKKDGKVRPDSWSDLVVAGRPAASLITDLTDGANKFTVYHVYAMTETSSLKFRFMIPADRFTEVRPVVDSILASCKAG
jgi:hypothetical protein